MDDPRTSGVSEGGDHLARDLRRSTALCCAARCALPPERGAPLPTGNATVAGVNDRARANALGEARLTSPPFACEQGRLKIETGAGGVHPAGLSGPGPGVE